MKQKKTSIISEIITNRVLIQNLAKTDFKTKFAGSYLGTIWAFVSPVITVLVYWFVFEVAWPARAISGNGLPVPYVLWLIAGLIPWFYFSECIGAGAGALREYSYLVKKVVFQIDILPAMKMISSTFVHLFFVAFGILVYACMGIYPNLYFLQLIYYSLCVLVLSTGISYFTSAVSVIFPDLRQIVGIVLQVGIWMTPIMWKLDDMADKIPGWALLILKANPMYYIVNGYRDSLVYGVGFWERPGLTAYFWIFTIVVFYIGIVVFKRLKAHFADVL